jgi:hypothetical protein
MYEERTDIIERRKDERSESVRGGKKSGAERSATFSCLNV